MNIYTEKMLTSGEELLAQGWMPRGIALIERAIDDDPEDNQVMLRAATAYERYGALPNAMKTYRRLADHFVAFGRPDKARQLHERIEGIRELVEQACDLEGQGAAPTRKPAKKAFAPDATIIFRPHVRSAVGFLAFCLGVLCAMLPLSVPEIGDRLDALQLAPVTGGADGMDGRTRASLGLVAESDLHIDLPTGWVATLK